MKKLMIIASCALLLLAAGCKEKNQPESLYGHATRPAWTAPEEYDYNVSMTAVIKVENLNGQIVNDPRAAIVPLAGKEIVNDSDLLAAFSGETCLGVASPQDDLFFLYMAQPSSLQGGDGGRLVTLRYYSAHFSNLFEAKDAFPFRNDDHLGTVAEPLTPAFVVVK